MIYKKHLLKGSVLKSIMEGNITALDIQNDIGYENINTLCKELFYLTSHKFINKIDIMGKLHYSLTDKGFLHAKDPYVSCHIVHNGVVMGGGGNNMSEVVLNSNPQAINQEVIPFIPATPIEPFKSILNNPLKNLNFNVITLDEVKDIQPYMRHKPAIKEVVVKGHKKHIKKQVVFIS